MPKGDYDVMLFVTDTDWMAIRSDRKAGGTWLLSNMIWRKVAEPE